MAVLGPRAWPRALRGLLPGPEAHGRAARPCGAAPGRAGDGSRAASASGCASRSRSARGRTCSSWTSRRPASTRSGGRGPRRRPDCRCAVCARVPRTTWSTPRRWPTRRDPVGRACRARGPGGRGASAGRHGLTFAAPRPRPHRAHRRRRPGPWCERPRGPYRVEGARDAGRAAPRRWPPGGRRGAALTDLVAGRTLEDGYFEPSARRPRPRDEAMTAPETGGPDSGAGGGGGNVSTATAAGTAPAHVPDPRRDLHDAAPRRDAAAHPRDPRRVPALLLERDGRLHAHGHAGATSSCPGSSPSP